MTRLLVVEDDPAARDLLTQMLTEMEFDVVSAADAYQGLAYLDSGAPCDAVISDVVMPRMSGVEFSTYARNRRPELPVVLLTGKPAGFSAAMDAGAFVIGKPITRETLLSVLTEALEQRSSDR